MRRKVVLTIAVIGIVAGCGSTEEGPVGPAARVDSIQVIANPHNVLSARVQFFGEADSARVLFRAAGTVVDLATPGFVTADDSTAELYALGLYADTTYSFRVVGYGPGGTDTSAAVEFSTGSLPNDLPAYAASGTDPLPGFTVFQSGAYGIVIDNTGRVVWYRVVNTGAPGLNFMMLASGHYAGRPTTIGGDPLANVFVLYDAIGDSVRAVGCLNGKVNRFHDLLVQPDGSYWIMCDDSRTVDMTPYGGSATAKVTGTAFQHITAAGTLALEWTPFDHFAYTDADSATLVPQNVNWTHGNAMALDTDGNLLVSFRGLNEVTKINATTGAVMWRMGGKANQFTFQGPNAPGFAAQHNVRSTGFGEFMILDNLGSADSRFERYAFDTAAMTATLLQSYAADPPVSTSVGGSVQAPAPGRWLVSIGTTGTVHEFDATGTLLWRIDGNPGYVFRAQKFPSLYRPGLGAPR